MPSLKEKLAEEMKTAMKARDQERLAFIRNLHAAIRKTEIDSKQDLDDAGVQKIVGTSLKQRRDSVEQFKKGGRDDLVAAEQAEIVFLESYLPPQLSEDELSKIIAAAVSESGATSAKEIGKVMKVLMPKVQGRADGKLVNQLVRAKLG